jgi:putative transposase
MLRLFIVFNSFPYHFITLSIVGWVDLFTRQECRDIMIESFKYCQKNKGLVINAYVIMSNHIHMIIRANENSDGLSDIDLKLQTSDSGYITVFQHLHQDHYLFLGQLEVL